MKANAQIAEEVKALATKKNCTSAQVCLAWVLAQGENVVVIPGTTSLKRLEENIASVNVKLTEQELESLRRFESQVQGDRY
jgi:aryl-alcohol dehydrogenase-like predicted oxidoreductase